MVMERPASFWFPTFSGRFGNIMQQGSPTQPKIIRFLADIIKYFQRMIKVILMRTAIPCFYPLQSSQFGKD